MNLTEEQIKSITDMAELFYSPEEIAINIEVDPDELRILIQAKEGSVYDAYMQGWLTGDIALRRSIARAAENGSNPAQQMMRDYQKQNTLL